jgi:hypothetical protein
MRNQNELQRDLLPSPARSYFMLCISKFQASNIPILCWSQIVMRGLSQESRFYTSIFAGVIRD